MNSNIYLKGFSFDSFFFVDCICMNSKAGIPIVWCRLANHNLSFLLGNKIQLYILIEYYTVFCYVRNEEDHK